jgi:thiamine-phosphate pyrophosphorylase
MKMLTETRLYAFVDTAYLHGRGPEVLAQQLCDGGADLIQLRAKELPVEEVQRLAESILPITERAGVGLVINDHPAVALAVGAPYCHLGQEDFFGAGYTHVSQLLAVAPQLSTRNPQLLLGLSSHAPEQARRAVAAGAAYLGVGPVYATGTKPAARPVTLNYVRWAAQHVPIPWFAIGGISLENLDEVLAAGARRVCVVSAILNAPDAAQACRRFKDRLLSQIT